MENTKMSNQPQRSAPILRLREHACLLEALIDMKVLIELGDHDSTRIREIVANAYQLLDPVRKSKVRTMMIESLEEQNEARSLSLAATLSGQKRDVP